MSSRLQAESQRLYGPGFAQPTAPAIGTGEAVAAPPEVSAMVIELARPAHWPAVARLWQAVQDDLKLPAPAIAVNGVDGYQLWFSVERPVPTPQAVAFLDALRARYWAEIPVERIAVMPVAPGHALQALRHGSVVPALSPVPGQWSAFVARDLAPVFSEAPWLDIPPNPEGQADLLTALRPCEAHAVLALARRSAPTASSQTTPPERGSSADLNEARDELDPRRFLLGVMNDPKVDLALRIEAAKALLPHTGRRSPA